MNSRDEKNSCQSTANENEINNLIKKQITKEICESSQKSPINVTSLFKLIKGIVKIDLETKSLL